MPRRGDNIRKRKDGRWEARYAKETGGENASKYGSVYGKTYKEAKAKRDQIIFLKNTQPIKTDSILFRDILAAWQESNRIRLKGASVSRYQNLIDTHILPELGDKSMPQINGPLINRYLIKKLENGRIGQAGGLSPAYVRSISFIISAAIRFGAAHALCAPLQFHITKPVLKRKEELVILDADKQAILEKELLRNMNNEKLLIYITLYTGLRIGEVCALRWEDIDMQDKLLYVRQTVSRIWHTADQEKKSELVIATPKTAASLRCIPLCSKLYASLCNFSQRKECGYILQNTKGDSFISPRTFEYRYKAILKQCALEPVNYHTLRHTFATRCIERGVDVKSLSEILGHASVDITLDTYVHSSIELKRIQLEKFVV